MMFVFRLFTACVFLLCGSVLPADDSPANATGDEPARDAAATESATATAKPALDAEMSALRDRVRGALDAQSKQTFNTHDNSPTEILSRCLAFGCDSEVRLDSPQGRRINGITCLCWNYPCACRGMLGYDGEQMTARIGYGYQERPGEFLAMLAMSRVPPDYPARVGKDVRKVADLVEAEKLACRAGCDKSLALIGLSYYTDDPVWKNSDGEEWTVERIVEEVLARPVVSASDEGLNRLLGLGYVVARREAKGQPIEGQFERAKKYTSDFHDYALRLQNSNGSWGPKMLAAKSASNDPADQLRATGRVLEWLAVSLPDERLREPRIVQAVNYLAQLLGNNHYRWNAHSLSTREIASLGHALHALAIYDQRVFKPYDDAEPESEPDAAATIASVPE